jgi:flagellar assembly factor FliW
MMNATATAVQRTTSVETYASGDGNEHRGIRRLVHFRHGLFGFPEHRQFVLRSTDHEGLYWLQSAEDDTLAFLLADPFVYVRDYVVELHDSEVAELETTAASDLVILAIVTLPRTAGGSCTLNLQGPLAIDLRTGRAKQVILPDSEYGLRHPVDLARRVDA